jgi:hypothetical protein
MIGFDTITNPPACLARSVVAAALLPESLRPIAPSMIKMGLTLNLRLRRFGHRGCQIDRFDDRPVARRRGGTALWNPTVTKQMCGNGLTLRTQ